ncbi:MAG: TIGR04063 family PEP-CTERM/XrtA system glycosyltransferase [Thiohalomonadales bacterium]
MKVLHVLDHSIPLHSGYTFRTMAILLQQRKMGWETIHVTSPKHNLAITPEADEEDVDGLHFYRTVPSSGMFGKLPIVNQAYIIKSLEKRLIDIVKKVKPDILHAHSPALNGLATIKVGKRYNIPVVYEIRAFWEDAAVDHGTSKEGGLRYNLTRALETYVTKRADKVTTICEGLRSDLLNRGLAENKITVIPNAVDIEKFEVGGVANLELKKRLGLYNKMVIGFIGSFYAYEGLLLLLDATVILLKDNSDISLLLVGGGPDTEKLKRLVSKYGIEKQVVFTGRVPHNEVQSYYNLVDIFVYPRLAMRLTNLVTPLKPLEAMAQGRLVLASDVGGHKELITPGVTGELFEAGNAVPLAKSNNKLLPQKNNWNHYRKAGREFVETERSWPISVKKYKAVYEGLLCEQLK